MTLLSLVFSKKRSRNDPSINRITKVPMNETLLQIPSVASKI